MATLVKKKIKNKYYYYLVEVKRINGKPKYTNQIYLGSAESVINKLQSAAGIPDPIYSIVLDFGDVAALYDLSYRLGVVELLNDCVGKRNQGVSVGEYILIAALNRAVSPTSKTKISEWFNKTILSRIMPIEPRALKCQRFWDNMGLIDDNAIQKFEDAFVRQIVESYNLSTSCLIYDATNFYTYIDTSNNSKLAKRGHSKEKRNDLKIIGLSMMISPDHNVPLFYEIYPGNRPDAVQFENVVKQLKHRYDVLTGKSADITLVFDRGNNSEDNIELLQNRDFKFHFVGGLRLSQCKELLTVTLDKYERLSGDTLEGSLAYKSIQTLYGMRVTVLVVYNPELYKGQMQGIANNIETAIEKLNVIQGQLTARRNGVVVKGRKPTLESVQKRVKEILTLEYMSNIFDTNIYEEGSFPILEFSLNNANLERIQNMYLGKSILFTDHMDWSNEAIVSAYRSAWHIENAFKQMKDTNHLTVRPIWHWTDQKIKVHVFYCVLAYRLCCLLLKEFEGKGFSHGINEMLSQLSEIKQVINVYDNKHTTVTYSLTQTDKLSNQLLEALDIFRYRLVR